MSTGRRILVVDDDAGGRRLTRATLVKAGFEVAEARDGQQAIEMLQAGLPDLVLMDVSMPVLDGFEACAGLRRIPGGNRVPVVMMTGLDDVESIERAFGVGATDFITKPINWAILPHRVRYMLRASAAINGLEQNQRRLSNAQRIGEMGDWELDVRSGLVLPSEQALRLFAHEQGQVPLTLEKFLGTVHPRDIERLRRACLHAVGSGESFSIDHRIVTAEGRVRHVRQQVEVVEIDGSGRALRLAGAVHDVTRRKDAEEQIRRLAYYDPLTGLPNRLLFTEQLRRGIAQGDVDGSQVAIMFIDLDNFKRVNDTLGHAAGDDLLRLVSTRLVASLRDHDVVSRVGMDHVQVSRFGDDHFGAGRAGGEPVLRGCTEALHHESSIGRLGGDEFIVMLCGIHQSQEAAAVARRLVTALSEPVIVQGTEIFVGCSVGIAIYPADGNDIDSLLMNADTAMYRAKESGRGGFQFYDRSMNARARDRLMMESQLRRALDRCEFVLHYQPRVQVETGRIVGAEALIRWQHPEQGLVPPQEFIPLVEDSGLVIPIGEWAIGEVCRQMAAWRADGLEPVPVAVNLAATHLREATLPVLVARALERHALAPSLLEIEVTESILLADPDLSLDIARRLGDMGVRLSIDDFGTGYSSLSYLKRLPISALKIDRSFVRDLAVDPDDAAITTAIIAMAHSLGLKVVAEGVENTSQLAFLKTLGCDEYQGFLMRPALPVPEFAQLLGQRALPRPDPQPQPATATAASAA